MKFVDEIKIEVEGGRGGNGLVAFRREKFVPFGGPSGGDGGRGGDVVLVARPNLTTLYELNFSRIVKAPGGTNGGPKDKEGANGKPVEIGVPIGTLVFDHDTNELISDLEEADAKIVVGKGGRGGRGNARFVSSVRRAPRIAEKGEPGEKRLLRLELKLLADVGLVGLPNAGKSTFLRSVSNARPKVADYPFTTLIPNLGIVKPERSASFCIADIPGLIAGAHQGAGLGIHFLKHIERTRVLVHLVDLAEIQTDNLCEPFDVIMQELANFDSRLPKKPMIVVANKMDLPDARERWPEFKTLIEQKGYTVLNISGATREGVDELLGKVAELLQQELPVQQAETPSNEKVYEFLSPFEFLKSGSHEWEVHGAEIERLVSMTDFSNEEAIALFLRKMKKMGFIEELKRLNADPEDVISISNMEFQYQEFFR